MTQQEESKDSYKDAEQIDAGSISLFQEQVNKIIEREKEEYGISEKTENALESNDVLEAINNGEDGDAALFIRHNFGCLVFDHKKDTWYVWKNNRWIEDKIDEHLVMFDPLIESYEFEKNRQISKQVDAVKNNDKDSEEKAKRIIEFLEFRISKLRGLYRRRNILKLSSSGEDSLGITGEEWDAQVDILPCENGMYDLKNRTFRDYLPEDYIRTIAPVEFKGVDRAAPNFEKFLNTTFNNNKELIAFVQRLMGSAISGSVVEHCVPILWGPNGRNGKTTLLEVLEDVMGPLAGPIQTEMLLKPKYSKSSSDASADILNLKGRRIVWASEIEKKQQFNASTLKLLSGGDTLSARGLYKKTYTEFTPTHSVFLITNYKPNIPADDNALWERIFLIPFEVSFVDKPKRPYERKRDPGLKEKLLQEKSGILAWLLRGYHAYQREGLNPPDIVAQHVDQYKEEMDSIISFTKDCCEIKEGMMSNATDLYVAYKEYCINNNLHLENPTNFGRKLTKIFEKIKHKGKMYYKGILLQTNC